METSFLDYDKKKEQSCFNRWFWNLVRTLVILAIVLFGIMVISMNICFVISIFGKQYKNFDFINITEFCILLKQIIVHHE